QVSTRNLPGTLLINPGAPPFDNPELRRAMGLAFDRKAFLDILNAGKGAIGGNMMPPPNGAWGMPPEVLQTLPGYGPDVEKNRAEARKIMEKLGYGPDKRLAIKLSTRNFPAWRDPAVIMISHLKEIYIDAELDLVDTALWYSKMARKDYTVGAVPIESGVDDPDQMFYENYVCGALRNYAGYCNPELDKLVNQQSIEVNPEKRKQLVWQIERVLAEAGVRSVLFYPAAASCWRPWVKDLTLMTNSIYNGWRMEDVWLDKKRPPARAEAVITNKRVKKMLPDIRISVTIGAVLIALAAANPALAQKQGGVLRLSHFDSPASMSILEESTRAAEQPMMHVFNNLIMYKQDVAQTSLLSIVPDLATSWS